MKKDHISTTINVNDVVVHLKLVELITHINIESKKIIKFLPCGLLKVKQ